MTERADTPSTDPADLHERIARGEPVQVLDLRDRDEVAEWAIEGPSVDLIQAPAVSFLQANVQGSLREEAVDRGLDAPVVVCAEGKASAEVAGMLQTAGIDAANLAGGMDAWATLVVSATVASDPTVVQYLRPASGCASYLIVDEGEAAVVDPLASTVERYLADVADRQADLVAAVDTHVHADHVSGVRAVAAGAGLTPTLPDGAADRGLTFEVDGISDGDRIEVGDASVEAIHAPGHTTEMTAFRVADVLLTGDSLFLESVARPDLEADVDPRDGAARLYDSLHDRILDFPGETVVAPGHVAPGTHRRADGTYADSLASIAGRLDLLDLDRETFVERIVADLPPRPANDESIVAINLGLEPVPAGGALELELGPNNCAVNV